MLEKSNQVKAYKELRKSGVHAPYSLTKSHSIVEKGTSEEKAWSGLVDSAISYPANMTASIKNIRAIATSCEGAANSGNAMIDALSHATTPNEFIPLGIGFDVIQKTEDNPPATFLINDCISDHLYVDTVYDELSAMNVGTVKPIMSEINALLSTPEGDTGGGSSSGGASVPDATIKRLEAAIAPNLTISTKLTGDSASLITLANNGNKAKNDAITAFNYAVQVSVIGSITGADGVMNDVIGAVVPKAVIDALREK